MKQVLLNNEAKKRKLFLHFLEIVSFARMYFSWELRSPAPEKDKLGQITLALNFYQKFQLTRIALSGLIFKLWF